MLHDEMKYLGCFVVVFVCTKMPCRHKKEEASTNIFTVCFAFSLSSRGLPLAFAKDRNRFFARGFKEKTTYEMEVSFAKD